MVSLGGLLMSLLLNLNRRNQMNSPIRGKQSIITPIDPVPPAPVATNPAVIPAFPPAPNPFSGSVVFPTPISQVESQAVTTLNIRFRPSKAPQRLERQETLVRDGDVVGIRLMLSPVLKAIITQLPDYSECGVAANGTFSGTVPAQPELLTFMLAFSNGRIIGGLPAVDGDWPWMAYIYERPNGIGAGLCGGSLISNKWILTAAHCIETPNPALYGVVLGAHSISRPSGREIFRFVTRIVPHPLYDSLSFNYDALLLELDVVVNFNEFVRPVCLVPSGTRTDNNDTPTFAGSVCTTLGWGFTSSPVGALSDVLMRLDLFIVPSNLCEVLTVSNSTAYLQRPVFEGSPKFCASGQTLGQDSCNGDSGGPLMCLHPDGKYYLHGITSYGTTTCAVGLPGVYTKVSDPMVRGFISATAMV